jgi:hypothetical protein
MNEGRCDERLKGRVEESTCLRYTVERQNKLEIPRDNHEANNQEIHECDGRVNERYRFLFLKKIRDKKTGDKKIVLSFSVFTCVHIHWVARQNKLEIPRDKDEVNIREIHECDG